MKKQLAPFFIGIFLGLVFVKSEVISWFRIEEMFYFKSIHMYGTFTLAILIAIFGVFLIKKFKLKSIGGSEIKLEKKPFNQGVIFGGLLFGIGWAFTGACPGPVYTLFGTGEPSIVFILAGIFAGVVLFGLLKSSIFKK